MSQSARFLCWTPPSPFPPCVLRRRKRQWAGGLDTSNLSVAHSWTLESHGNEANGIIAQPWGASKLGLGGAIPKCRTHPAICI
jgi:hypothetical protein